MHTEKVKTIILTHLDIAITDLFENDPTETHLEKEFRKRTMIDRLKYVTDLINTFPLESYIDNETRNELWSKAYNWTEEKRNLKETLA
jgi:enolase